MTKCSNLSKPSCDKTFGCTWREGRCKDSSSWWLFLLLLAPLPFLFKTNPKASCDRSLQINVLAPKAVNFWLYKDGILIFNEEIALQKKLTFTESGWYGYVAEEVGYKSESGNVYLDCTPIVLDIALESL